MAYPALVQKFLSLRNETNDHTLAQDCLVTELARDFMRMSDRLVRVELDREDLLKTERVMQAELAREFIRLSDRLMRIELAISAAGGVADSAALSLAGYRVNDNAIAAPVVMASDNASVPGQAAIGFVVSGKA